MWLTEAHTSQEAPFSKNGSSSLDKDVYYDVKKTQNLLISI